MGKKTSLFHTKTFFNDYFLMQAICINLLLYQYAGVDDCQQQFDYLYRTVCDL